MEKEKNRIIPIMEQQIFPFLLANGIEPVIISGSPKEPLETYKKRMGFQNVYALEYKIEDGKYTDEYSINTSVGDGKEWIIQNFLEKNPDAQILFGFGDSEADIPILKSARQGFVNNTTKILDKDNVHYLDFESEKAGEEIIELMTQELERLDEEKYEVLACVDENGEITGEYVNRKFFYSGKCLNKHICGVVFWIFDKEGNVLLTERGAEKEQGTGKISPPSGHVQYKRKGSDEEERPIVACFNEIGEELGLTWDYQNFPFTDAYYPVGIIQQPARTAEGCRMIVKHYALLLTEDAKEKIKNNEAKRIFFEPWNIVSKKFGEDDNEKGEYEFFGTNKKKILYELDGFAYKIEHLEQLGPDATWDTLPLDDIESVEIYRQEKHKRAPEERAGYVTWEMTSMSTKDELWNFPGEECVVFDTITVREDVNLENFIDIIKMTAKDIPTKIEKSKVETEKGHTKEEFSEIVAPQTEISNMVGVIREINCIKRKNREQENSQRD